MPEVAVARFPTHLVLKSDGVVEKSRAAVGHLCPTALLNYGKKMHCALMGITVLFSALLKSEGTK